MYKSGSAGKPAGFRSRLNRNSKEKMETNQLLRRRVNTRFLPWLFLLIILAAAPAFRASGQTSAGGPITPNLGTKEFVAEGSHSPRETYNRVPPTTNKFTGVTVLQAYPNPTTGPVNFEFMIAADARVIMDLYNTSGVRIATLFNADVRAGTPQKIYFADTLSDGLYIYILRYGNERATGKLVIKR
jgi:hypothetical protein